MDEQIPIGKSIFLKVRVQGKSKQKVIFIPKGEEISEGDYVRINKVE